LKSDFEDLNTEAIDDMVNEIDQAMGECFNLPANQSSPNSKDILQSDPIVQVTNEQEINSDLKFKLWRMRNGNSMDGKCYICLQAISLEDWYCVRLLPNNDSLDNLYPGCKNCYIRVDGSIVVQLTRFERNNGDFSSVLLPNKEGERYLLGSRNMESGKAMSSSSSNLESSFPEGNFESMVNDEAVSEILDDTISNLVQTMRRSISNYLINLSQLTGQWSEDLIERTKADLISGDWNQQLMAMIRIQQSI